MGYCVKKITYSSYSMRLNKNDDQRLPDGKNITRNPKMDAFELLSNKILLARNQNQRQHLHKNKDTGCRSIVKVNQSRAWSRFGKGSTSVSVGTQFLDFNSGRVHK